MRSIVIALILFALVGTAFAEGPIHHTVFFTLKHEPGSDEEVAFLAALDELAEIPGVVGFARVREVSPKNPFTHGLLMRFADQVAYDAYNAHPAHMSFVQERWAAEVGQFQEIDFIVDADQARVGSTPDRNSRMSAFISSACFDEPRLKKP